MTNYTVTEIVEAVGAGSGYDSRVAYQLEDSRGQTIELRGEDVPVEQVDSAGGEDQGSNIWFVVKIGDQHFRKSGYYASHYGTDWDGPFEEVTPREKTITVWEAA